jgi:hypothetical protein
MTVRDLGYRPYEGARLPPANNTWVMLRHGLARAWASWLVKIAIFLSLGPTLVVAATLAVVLWFMRTEAPPEAMEAFEPTQWLRRLYTAETWIAVSLLTLGAGAPAIAEDLTFRAFQFYFAKPVTPEQYYAGRALAVAIPVFAVTFVPAILVDVVLVAMMPHDQAVEMLGLVLPCLMYSLILAVVMGSGSVAISSLSKSRALTMSAWVLCFVVPHALAAVVDAIGHWPWLYLGSFTGLLGVVADALFRVDSHSDLHWWHAVPVLAAFVVASVSLSLYRLRAAEVIT